MRFFGNDEDLTELKSSQENLIDAVLMNAYNAGCTVVNKSFMDFRNQAMSAISQGIVQDIPAGQNPFLDVVKEYIKIDSFKKKDNSDSATIIE